ncbi:hypothetical protein Salat_2508400, partial [Sesamum alatum]
MVLGVYVDFDVWAGGVLEWVPKVRYVGCIRMLFSDVDLERLYYGDLLDMYAKTGGKGLNVQIYYCLPGHTLDNGITLLHGDDGIRDLCRIFKGLSVVPIYFEEKQGPLLALDTQGNILPLEEHIPSLPSVEIPQNDTASPESQILDFPEMPEVPHNSPDLPPMSEFPQNIPDLPPMSEFFQNIPEFPEMSEVPQNISNLPQMSEVPQNIPDLPQ